MSRRPTIQEALKLQSLINREEVNKSSMSGPVFSELIAAGHFTWIRKGKGGRGSYRARNPEYLSKAIRQIWQIDDLGEYIAFLEKEDKDRTDVQKMLGGTKEHQTSTFQGFLVHSTDTIPYDLSGRHGSLPLAEGSYLFISDYVTFRIPEDVVVVYVENFTCFRLIERYQYLFKPGRYIYISRLLSSNAFKEWIKTIPNRYIHFGDFDLAGIDIYLHFYNEIGERASFLIPEDIEERIMKYGNSKLFYKHEDKYHNMAVTDMRVQPIVDIINKYRMGYEQEGYAT